MKAYLRVSNGLCEHLRTVRLLLRSRAVINFLMRAASTLKITNGEQQALREFSASWNLFFFLNVVLRQVI